MTDLDELIVWWRLVVETSAIAISTSFLAKILDTIKHLEELKKLKGE